MRSASGVVWLWIEGLLGCGLRGCGVVGLWDGGHQRRTCAEHTATAWVLLKRDERRAAGERTRTRTQPERARERERERERQRKRREKRGTQREREVGGLGVQLAQRSFWVGHGVKGKIFALRARLFASRLPASALAVQMSSSKHVPNARKTTRVRRTALWGCGVVGHWVVGLWGRDKLHVATQGSGTRCHQRFARRPTCQNFAS